MKKDIIRVAFVGAGQRGPWLLKQLSKMSDVRVLAVCDKHEDRTQKMKEIVEKEGWPTPFTTQNYKDIIARGGIDAAVIATDWNMHIPIAIDFMEAGINPAFEVGGCDSVEECWDLVRTYRKTGVECMMLENCCYAKREMQIFNMVKQGLFGDIIHCDGGYMHDLREEILTGKEKRQYRLRNYMNRNCDNYPTHQLGPIAKILNINHGNRFVSLTSMASRAAGIKQYIKEHDLENKDLKNTEFMQGDVVMTMIKCARGETITLTLDTTLPHFYSRNYNVCGTKGRYDENTNCIYCQELDPTQDPEGRKANYYNNMEKYSEEYKHPLWKEYEEVGVRAGHGGMDWLVLRAFIESMKAGTKPPVDAYDAAAWMCISPLSEQSIAKGSMPVDIPDFTYGQWIEEFTPVPSKYSLDVVYEDRSIPIYPEDCREEDKAPSLYSAELG